VRDLRGLAEHLDKDIIEGKLPANAEVAIHLGWDKASLAETEMSYVDFARWVGQLHYFALLLSRIQVTVGDPVTNKSEKDDA
jgi:hypothetical protein